jgi:hypothetical protein
MLLRFSLILLLHFNINLTIGQDKNWVSLPGEVNNFVTQLGDYKGKMLALGYFTKAGNITANGIALWNDTSWSTLGSGLRGGDNSGAYKGVVFNDELYVVGHFDTAGETACRNVAKWNGTAWSSLGLGGGSENYPPSAITVYKNDIYVGGKFDSMGGIKTNNIARWDGQQWHALGTGVNGTGIGEMYVYKDELYVTGSFDSAGNVSANRVARWNGSSWNNAGAGIKSCNALFEWENKLLVASQIQLIGTTLYREVNQWDGNSWSLFNRQTFFPIEDFVVFKNRLYCCGGNLAPLPKSYSLVGLWDKDSSKWEIVDSGINAQVTSLFVFNNKLHCGGFFNKGDDCDHNFIARLEEKETRLIDPQKREDFRIFPNPGSGKIHIEANDTYWLKIMDVTGRIISSGENIADITLPKGTYFFYLDFELKVIVKNIIVL